MSCLTLAAAFESDVRGDALGSGAQGVQAVPGVVSPVTSCPSSLLSQLEGLLSLCAPAVSKTAVSDADAFWTGRFLQSLLFTHKHTQTLTVRQAGK